MKSFWILLTVACCVTAWEFERNKTPPRSLGQLKQPLPPKERLIDAATQIIISSFGDVNQPANIAHLTQAAVELEWTDWWEYQCFSQAAAKMTVVSRRISQLLTDQDSIILKETTEKVGTKVSYRLTGPSIDGTGEIGIEDIEGSVGKAKAVIDRLPSGLQDEYQKCFDSLLRCYEHLLVAARNGESSPIPKPILKAIPVEPDSLPATQPNPRELPPPQPRPTTQDPDPASGEERARYPHEVIFDLLFGHH